MNIIILCNHPLALPTIQALAEAKLLRSIATTNNRPDFQFKINPLIQHYQLPFLQLTQNNWQKRLTSTIKNQRIDVVFVLTFKYKIPAKLLNLPKWGFINFHPGPLPQYRGPDPVFWQLKNQVKQGTLTVHQMDANFDTGQVISAAHFPNSPIMTHSRFMNEAGYVAVQLASGILQLLQHTGQLPLRAQTTQNVTYHPRPTLQQRSIDWQQQDALAIQALVNACNSSYGGALMTFRQQPLQVLQATPLEEQRNTATGQVVYADATNGWVVATKTGQLLRIDIVQSGEGVMTGRRFVEMAVVKVGEMLK